MTFHVPEYEVDQAAAALRDIDAPSSTTKAIASAFDGSARAIERLAAEHPARTMTLTEVAGMFRAMGVAFTAAAAQQDRGAGL